VWPLLLLCCSFSYLLPWGEWRRLLRFDRAVVWCSMMSESFAIFSGTSKKSNIWAEFFFHLGGVF
jgi:hypothetical protein